MFGLKYLNRKQKIFLLIAISLIVSVRFLLGWKYSLILYLTLLCIYIFNARSDLLRIKIRREKSADAILPDNWIEARTGPVVKTVEDIYKENKPFAKYIRNTNNKWYFSLNFIDDLDEIKRTQDTIQKYYDGDFALLFYIHKKETIVGPIGLLLKTMSEYNDD